MNQDQKYLLIGAGAYVFGVATSISAQALYARNKIGADYKTMAISGTITVGVVYTLLKYVK